MKFTEEEKRLIKDALDEIHAWLSTDNDFTVFNSIYEKFNFNKQNGLVERD